MAKREQVSKRVASDPWVPAGLTTPSRGSNGRSSNGRTGEAEEWLPGNGNGGHARNGGESYGGVKAPTRRRKRHRLPKRATPRERWLILRLRRSRRRLDEQSDEVDRLRRRVSELEAIVAEHREPPKRTPAKPARKTKPATRTTAAKRTPSNGKRATSAKNRRNGKHTSNGKNGRNGKLDLNAATFDQLRGLGLSITQTSRLISQREADGGFGSVSELEEVKGLSRATLTTLRSQVRVGAR